MYKSKWLGIAVIALAFYACRHETDEVVPKVGATARMEWTFVRGDTGHTYTLDTLLQDSTHRYLKVDDIRFYVTGIQALDDDDNVIGDFTSQCHLVDIAHTNDFELGTIYASHIHEYILELGVQPNENNSDPSTALPPLNDTAMYWATAPPQGYKFLRVRGHYDADADGHIGPGDPAFSYDCGTDAMLTSAFMHLHHDFTEGELYTSHAHVNMGLLFDHIDVSATPTGEGADPVCARMMQNLSDVIFGEEH